MKAEWRWIQRSFGHALSIGFWGSAVICIASLVFDEPGRRFQEFEMRVCDGRDDSDEGGGDQRDSGACFHRELRLPFKAAYMFRPGVIQPLHGVQSKTRMVRVLYSLMTPFLPLLRRAMPGYILTTEQLGRAMLAVAKRGAPKRVLESRHISAIARA